MSILDSIGKFFKALGKHNLSLPHPQETKERPREEKSVYEAKEKGFKTIRTHYTRDLFTIEKTHYGGMGKVYKARRESDGRLYALKTIFMEKAKTIQEEERLIKRFWWEGQVWIVLRKHKNIVQANWVDRYWEPQGDGYISRPLLIMEYIEGDQKYGVSLKDWIKKYYYFDGKYLPLSFVFKISIEVLTGLLYAKKVMKEELNMEFIHRDLKSENILITKDRTAKVTDFGLVKAFSEAGEITLKVKEGEEERITFTATKGICGTPAYMAPEQWKGEGIDERADVYALGCILYEMITGRPPFLCLSFEDCKNAHLKRIPEPPDRMGEKIPVEIKELVLRCLSKERDKRPVLLELREKLQEIHKGLFGKAVKVEDEGEELTAEDWNNIGVTFSNLHFYKKAIFCYKKAIEINPSYAMAYNNRGLSYVDIREYQKAIADFSKAIEINPRYAEAYIGRGGTYRQLDSSPYSPTAPVNFSFWAYYKYLDYRKRAIADFSKAIEIDPGYAVAYYNRGEAYKAIDKPAKAIKDYRRFIDLGPAMYSRELEKAKKRIYELEAMLGKQGGSKNAEK